VTGKSNVIAEERPKAAGTSSGNRPMTVSRAALLAGGDDSAFRHMVHDLLAFSARLEAVRERFGSYLGLTGIQYTILVSVRHLQSEDGVGIKAIADHLGLSGAFVTIETGKLIRQGLLTKRPNPADRRRVLLQVSPEGEGRLAALAPMQREINDAIFAALDDEGFARLAAQAAELRKGADRALALADYLLVTGDKA
jgi:DNA-binding MarR family transcriptional regulator